MPYLKIYATGTNVATHNSKIQITNDRNATPHVDQSPISICPVLGSINHSDWLNVSNVKGQSNVLYYSLFLRKAMCFDRVRTGHGKPGKSWNFEKKIPGLESHGISIRVMESHGKLL